MHKVTLSKGDIPLLDSIVKEKSYSIRPAKLIVISSYWSGGSKDSFGAFDSCGQPVELPPHTGAPQFGGQSADVQVDGNPIAYLVNWPTFRGKRLPPTVYLQADQFERHATKAAEAVPELTVAQTYALSITAMYKSGARKDEWARRFPIEDYQPTRDSLVPLGLMRKNGAITPKGRNACEADRP